MKKFIVTITLFIALVGSISAKTTKVGDKQYYIKNSNYQDATYTVISEEEAMQIVDSMFKKFGIPLIVENNTGIDPEVASLVKKFEYIVYYTDFCVILHQYDKELNSYNTIIWT